jgi:hypothetical protein
MVYISQNDIGGDITFSRERKNYLAVDVECWQACKEDGGWTWS